MKFATNPVQHYPPHLRHVATLPWEIKKFKFSADIQQIADMKENANKLHLIASKFVIHPQILIFSVCKIASFPTY